MAHNINFNERTGKYSFFSVQQKAWHGLGQIVEQYPTSEEAIKYAGLDYEVVKSPLFTKGSGIIETANGIEIGSNELEGLRLMFWSGADFDEEQLSVKGGKYKDASIFYNSIDEINTEDLKRWLEKSKEIQWDYKNIVKRKGVLERLK
ncbi:MAG: hypothetical protein EAS52_06680 [Parapedobacter sp.]|nr:MAG: hypothetical protein EAS52_06680 [Parapedobacter sp.]